MRGRVEASELFIPDNDGTLRAIPEIHATIRGWAV